MTRSERAGGSSGIALTAREVDACPGDLTEEELEAAAAVLARGARATTRQNGAARARGLSSNAASHQDETKGRLCTKQKGFDEPSD